jgi:hypothetical protein
MSDESPRSAQGNAPQRRPTDAPAWWSQLDRDNLPDDETSVETSVRTSTGQPLSLWHTRPLAAPAGAPDRPRNRLHTVSAALVLTLAFLVVAWFGVGGGSSRSVLVVAVIFGVPVALTVIAVSLVLRRQR